MAESGGGTGWQARFRLGWFVFAALIMLTLVEYAVSVALNTGVALLVALVVFQLFDAGLILWYFMHLGQLWQAHET